MIPPAAVATGAECDPTDDLRGALPPPRQKHHATILGPKRIGGLLRAIDGYGQQAAEKAVKAVHAARGQEAWGHVVTELLQALGPSEEIDEALLDRARALDKLYIPTRCPNGLAGGAPTDFYTRAEAERAIGDAEVFLASCRRMLSRK